MLLSRSRSLVFLLMLVAPVAMTATACKSKPKPEVRLARTLNGVEGDVLGANDLANQNGGVAPNGLWAPNGAPDALNGGFGSGSMAPGSGSALGSAGSNGAFSTASLNRDSTGSFPNSANTEGIELGAFTSELEMIHFEYDKAEIADAWKAVLDQHAAWLAQNPNMMVQVEGHCDERGTEEYNMSLGQRRADIVRQYLIEKGVDPNRLSTLSYGKMRPLSFDGNEESMALNRRAMFLVYQMDATTAAAPAAETDATRSTAATQ